jgi:uncharacterized protein with von Willebrand factor type A (vWA) domain
VKEASDLPLFERLFPLYFGAAPPPPFQAQDVLSEDGQQMLEMGLQQLERQLAELLEQLLEGMPFSDEQINQALHASGLDQADRSSAPRLARSALSWLGFPLLRQALEALLEALRELGMSEAERSRLESALRANLEALETAVRRAAAAGVAEQRAPYPPGDPDEADLADQPFRSLTERQAEQLRHEAMRLAARLRTRASLRMKKGEGRRLDAKSTLRRNLRHAGVPFVIVPRTRRRKARFTLLCDVSTSMRPVVSFLLLLLYQIQDQVARTRSFAYIDHLVDISGEFSGQRPQEAIRRVLRQLPPGHYNTDLGRCLEQLVRDHADAVDGRTTLIFCADARNNFNRPRADLLEGLARRVRRVIWFNPESPSQWGTDDSDMLVYAPRVHAAYQVSNLRQLAQAVDHLFR